MEDSARDSRDGAKVEIPEALKGKRKQKPHFVLSGEGYVSHEPGCSFKLRPSPQVEAPTRGSPGPPRHSHEVPAWLFHSAVHRPVSWACSSHKGGKVQSYLPKVQGLRRARPPTPTVTCQSSLGAFEETPLLGPDPRWLSGQSEDSNEQPGVKVLVVQRTVPIPLSSGLALGGRDSCVTGGVTLRTPGGLCVMYCSLLSSPVLTS